MTFFRALTITLVLSLSGIAHAASDKYLETGVLQDKAGMVDTKTGSKVDLVMNMMGMKDPKTGITNWQWRYVLVLMPLDHNKIKQVDVLSPDGKPLELASPTQYFNNYDKVNKAGVKLYIITKEGFSFKLKVAYSE